MTGLLPSQFEEVALRSDLRRLLSGHIDMQFEDIRAILRLPAPAAPNSTAGGNFLAASGLLAVISGCSTLFYDAGPAAFQPPYENRARFLGVLEYMPWDPSEASLTRPAGAKKLYTYARNPLAHAFGVSYDPRKARGAEPELLQWSMAIAKAPLSLAQIHDLESSPERPTFAGPPLRRIRARTVHGAEELLLDVAGLYWAIHRMLHKLFADLAQVSAAEYMAGLLLRSFRHQTTATTS
jgi:hypothetical protein